MKVLMLGRPGLFDNYGGDRIQIENTAAELERIHVGVEIRTDIDTDLKEYDVIHVFQLDWNPDCYHYIRAAKKNNKPVVFSPIHHNLKELQRFEEEYVFDFRRISKIIFKNQYKRDVLKDVYRHGLRLKRWPILFLELSEGIHGIYKKALEMSDVILVQTEKEAEDIQNTYGLKINWEKVCNGVGKEFVDAREYANTVGYKDYIVCVGRIEPRKNQLSIIKAVKKIRDEEHADIKLVFVGAMSRNKHFEYNWRFNVLLNRYPWIKHISFVPYNQMPSIYKYAKVCVSASWFETTGLTSLEALVSGTNTVASGERAREYLGNYASYCDPGDPESIKDAVKKEYIAPRPVLTRDFMEPYTWEAAAKKTLSIYERLVSQKINWTRRSQ